MFITVWVTRHAIVASRTRTERFAGDRETSPRAIGLALGPTLGFSAEELRVRARGSGMKHIFKHVFASRSDYGDNLRAAAVCCCCVLNCSTRLREVSAGCKRRAATRNSPKLKPERIRACCGESVLRNSEDLLDVVGIAESLDLNRQWSHVIAWVHGPHRP